MAYTKQTWACDDLITADKLNHMEDGIEANQLPEIASADEGKVLGVSEGEYALIEQSGGGSAHTAVVLSGTIESVNRRGTGSKSYSTSELSALGITDIDDWAVVSIKQSDPRGGYRYGGMFGTDLGGMATYGNSYPLVTTSANGEMNISVLNPREETSGSDNIDYQVVLMKIA